jgi:hypothetical protein
MITEHAFRGVTQVGTFAFHRAKLCVALIAAVGRVDPRLRAAM